MININGKLVNSENNALSLENRGYKFGDVLFETMKFINGKILFWEDHYFRLMASMRILRMEIPMHFTMEFLEYEILKTVKANSQDTEAFRVRLNVDRGDGGKYLPLNSNSISFTITAEKLDYPYYSINSNEYILDIYKDFLIAPGMLSGIKTNNKVLQVMGSIFATENKWDNCIVLNTNKNVVEALNGNLFLVLGNVVKTPPLDDGCLRGVMRKQIVKILEKHPHFKLEESSFSVFELQKADELFITNVIMGIQPVSKYRKKNYNRNISTKILSLLNEKIEMPKN